MINRLPVWFTQELPSKEALELSQILRLRFKLNTICHSAKCPNISSCFSHRHATFLILGDMCTRNCRFCAVEYKRDKLLIDTDEPLRIAEAVKFLNLEYVVITSVTRDDLPDGGAQHFVETINSIKVLNKNIRIEILIPDFMGLKNVLEKLVIAKPEVISHNLETVESLYSTIRDRADYRRSLEVLKNIKLIDPSQTTKSSIMLGFGEKDIEIKEVLFNLHSIGCDMLVLGQYLRPSIRQYPVQKFYKPEEFKYWKDFAYDLGFKSVCAYPLARTSFQMKPKLTERSVRQIALLQFGEISP